MIKVGILGSTGRMGSHLIKNTLEDEELELATLHVFEIVDFSAPVATEALCEAILKNPKPIVVATTGFTPHQQNLLSEVAKVAPVLYSSNMSVGIALLKQLVRDVSSKLDAPSGTALTLAEFAAEGRGLDLDKVRVSGRDGQIGARTKDEIAVMALRGGDIVGRHTVGFYNDGE